MLSDAYDRRINPVIEVDKMPIPGPGEKGLKSLFGQRRPWALMNFAETALVLRRYKDAGRANEPGCTGTRRANRVGPPSWMSTTGGLPLAAQRHRDSISAGIAS